MPRRPLVSPPSSLPLGTESLEREREKGREEMEGKARYARKSQPLCPPEAYWPGEIGEIGP
jgi:hypothetical protein